MISPGGRSIALWTSLRTRGAGARSIALCTASSTGGTYVITLTIIAGLYLGAAVVGPMTRSKATIAEFEFLGPLVPGLYFHVFGALVVKVRIATEYAL